ncbi:MAG: hypothetical protein IJT79_08295 [Ruminococcus sp.]|nr:hypothetical protein [Ruminococcus sp.]
MTYRELLSIIADFFSVFSFAFSLLTFIMAVRLKKQLLTHVEKNDFLQYIDGQITDLESYYDTLINDESLYNENFLILLDQKLDEIHICYETILPKKLASDIERLRRLINKICGEDFFVYDEETKNKCARQLNGICVRLKKEKKLL